MNLQPNQLLAILSSSILANKKEEKEKKNQYPNDPDENKDSVNIPKCC